jgi:hypothetical protein
MEREMNPKEVVATKKKPSKAEVQKQKTDEAKTKQIYFASMRKKAEDHSVPESWIDSAINRINVGESDQEELVSELTTRYDLRESVAEHIVYLAEGEETKASVIMATKDMVDQITGWLEDTAQLKAEHLLELMDSIRETLGSDVASKYEQAVKPALESIYTTLETSRQGLSGALALVSGGNAPTMGAPTPEEGGLGGGEELPPVPDVGGAPDLGGEELPPVPGGEAGREKRESVDYSRKLGILLNSKKK